jgi:hypothetical protein
MKAQAKADGFEIRTGGPVLGNTGAASTWIPALLNNQQTAPYVDFVSYHTYLGGLSAIKAGLTWDNDSVTQSLYTRMQSTSYGVASIYQKVSDAVANGLYNSQVPIYVTEFNTNSAFEFDCCRNDPNYGPLFNSLFIADIFSTVYNGAQQPGNLIYFAAPLAPHFCLLECSNSQPNPQYSAYKLIGGDAYLGLNGGGHLAKSVSLPVTAAGLAVVAFYTNNQNAVLLVNPTKTDINNLQLTMPNSGLTPSQVTSYLMNGSNQQITPQTLQFGTQNGVVTATVSVPAYSTVGITVK